MKKIPPSEQIRQEISSLLSQGVSGELNILTELMKKGVQRLLQEALEQEVTDHLGRGHYQRHPDDGPHRGYRNGYEAKRLKTSEGQVELKVAQLRETLQPYESRVLPLGGTKTALLEHLVQENPRSEAPVEMYVRPEAIMINPDRRLSGLNRMTAGVKTVLFDAGNSRLIVVPENSGRELMVALPQNGQYDDIRVGDRVEIGGD